MSEEDHEDDLGEAANRESMQRSLAKAKQEVMDLGGWEGFWSGAWLLRLVQRSFKAYYNNANDAYFRQKYPTLDSDAIATKLISVAARNAGLLGIVTGAVISADEVVGIVTAGEAGVGIPANLAIAAVAISSEVLLLTRMQLQLIASLAKLYDVPLNPDDPEDVLTILAYAAGGAVAETAGKFGMKVGATLTEAAIRRYVRKEVLEFLQMLGRKVGVRILQRSIIKYAVPLASMGIGGGWNYIATRSVGRIACKHLVKRGRH